MPGTREAHSQLRRQPTGLLPLHRVSRGPAREAWSNQLLHLPSRSPPSQGAVGVAGRPACCSDTARRTSTLRKVVLGPRCTTPPNSLDCNLSTHHCPPLPGAETARDSCFQGSPAAPRLGVEIQSSLMVASAGAGAARPTAGRFTPRCRTVTQPRWRVGKADPGFPQSHIPKCRPQEPGLVLPQGASLQDPSGKKKGQTVTGLARRKGLRNPYMLLVGM